MSNSEKEKKNLKILLLLLILITLIAVGITIWALFFKAPDVVLNPDYAPKQEEPYQKPIEGDGGDKMEVDEGGGAVSLTYSSSVTIDLSDKMAILMFANPGKSIQDIVVQVVIQDQVILQSGRLTPGHQVTALELLDGAEKMLSVGGYDGKFVVLCYDPDSGEKAIVNTEIPIDITVIE